MNQIKRKIIVTGAAGFIGAALSKKLIQFGDKVVGIDNLNDYFGLHVCLPFIMLVVPKASSIHCKICKNKPLIHVW